jgi:glucosamine-6-phosphate deaminase
MTNPISSTGQRISVIPMPRVIEGARDAERVPTVVVRDHDTLAQLVADRIVEAIRRETEARGQCVLGLATGSTPIGIYNELIKRYEAGEVDFSHVVTFNLDEYYPMAPERHNSYRRYMWENLFAHINMDPKNIHIPDGTAERDVMGAACEAYEDAIVEAGGIDLQLLGIGRSGHIGFNEPGSPQDSRTRLISLDSVTRRDAAADFFGEENVPREAVTMGVATILDAREIILLATGEHKASIAQRSIEGDVSPTVAATFLQRHSNTTVYLDLPAAAARRVDAGDDGACRRVACRAHEQGHPEAGGARLRRSSPQPAAGQVWHPRPNQRRSVQSTERQDPGPLQAAGR